MKHYKHTRDQSCLLVAIVPAALVEAQAEHRGELRFAGDLGVLPEHLGGRGSRQQDEVESAALADPARPLSLSRAACACVVVAVWCSVINSAGCFCRGLFFCRC